MILKLHETICNICLKLQSGHDHFNTDTSAVVVAIAFLLHVLCTGKLTLGRIALSVTCLTAAMCLTADPGVRSLIPARSHTFREIDHEIISMAILLPSADSKRVVVSYKRNCVQEILRRVQQRERLKKSLSV